MEYTLFLLKNKSDFKKNLFFTESVMVQIQTGEKSFFETVGRPFTAPLYENMPLKDIAEQLGYANVFRFSKAFRKYHGVSTGQLHKYR